MMDNLNYYIFVSIFIVSLSSLLILTTTSFRRHRSSTTTPCPESYPLIGNLVGFLKNRHRFHDWVTDMLSTTPTLTLQVNGFLNLSHGICTADPTNIHHFLRSNFPNYVKGIRFTSMLHELLGNGIFNSDGQLWSSQRKIASHEFNTKSLRNFISETVQSQLSKSLIPDLTSAAGLNGEIVDLQQVLRKFSFYNICNVAFGVDPVTLSSDDSNNVLFFQAFDAALEHTSNRFLSPVPMVWKVKRFLNIGNERKFKEAIEIVNQFAMDIIKSKETQIEESKNSQDLLSRFMVSSNDMGYNNDEERRKFLRDIIISFILAGKDSTATALTWFFWLLDGHPHCKRLIYKEFTTLIASLPDIDHPKDLKFDELKDLNYLHAALSESMRLFPPVPINSRLTVNDDILPDGTRVKKGWFADYSAYAMGRMEKIWGADCREFKPERWLDDNGVYQPLDQFKYPVFHGGFRMCLGKEMAYLQMKSVVVAVMYEFEIEVIGGGGTTKKMVDPPYSLSLLLSMKNGLPIRLKKKTYSFPTYR
ncbi:cytochrome P450 94A1-like isoform X1 [Rutidosis leptorrhynchoides]|uniref:cytochrome P450 94A1-like isoform X1 n=1 Tax=Rutidosis leptorrhynchoides TaxID=125765 RepID=UPI003A9A1AB9